MKQRISHGPCRSRPAGTPQEAAVRPELLERPVVSDVDISMVVGGHIDDGRELSLLGTERTNLANERPIGRENLVPVICSFANVDLAIRSDGYSTVTRV